MPALITADLHQTDNPRDSYRWGLFPWLCKQAKQHGVRQLFLLGDLTDAKDRHSAVLTNRMVEEIGAIAADGVEVFFVPGNHDGIDASLPYFGFLKRLERVHVVLEPTTVSLGADLGSALCLPHTKNHQQDWKGLAFKEEYIFTHQTYDGCVTENGTRLSGISPSVFAKTKAKVYSGDIHVPQKVGRNIEYVGAPYRIRFGDSFKPRVLLLNDNGEPQDLHFATVEKHLIELDGDSSNITADLTAALDRHQVYEGDQVKLRVRLPRQCYADWPQLRTALIAEARAQKIELTGPELVGITEPKGSIGPKSGVSTGRSHQEVLLVYAKEKGLPAAALEAGQALLAQALKQGHS